MRKTTNFVENENFDRVKYLTSGWGQTMGFMIAFGLASVMLCLGMLLRTKVPFFRNMLVPSSVIAGLLGLIVMNMGVVTQTDAHMFSQIVNILFTLTFISIGLTGSKSSSKTKENAGKNIIKGSIGLGFTWNILYALTPAVGAAIILLIGSSFGMSAIYGLLIPFGFAQGPGQAATFGTIFEQQYGIENAAMVGITFAVMGYIACFLIGVPLAKYGLRKGLAKNIDTKSLEGFVKRGYYTKSEKRISMGDETTYSGNMDTMTFHFAIIGITFLLAVGLAELVSYIPGLGATLSGMLFMYGLIGAYFVRAVMSKLKIDHLLDNNFQTKITGWSTDYLVVASFMAIQFSLIANWLIPIMTVAIVVSILSFIIVMYFGKRYGSDYDFARTIGLFGTATGTVPSGIALIRIIDPSLRTNAAAELGLMNLPMMFSLVTLSTILAIASGALSISTGILLLLAPIPVYLIVLKVFKMWGKKTYVFSDAASSNKVGIRRERNEVI